MAISTPVRRASVQAYTLGLLRPVPDGTVGEGDRAMVTWLYHGIDYQGVIGIYGGLLFPPRNEDPRVVLFFNEQGVTNTRGIDYEFRLALALDMGLTEAQALTVAVQDMWKVYRELNGIDESPPLFFPI